MHQTLDEVLAQRATQTPAAPAVVHGVKQLNYEQLEARVGAIAESLHGAGVGPETIVAVCLQRSSDLVATFLAVFRARGAFLPLDTGYPQERLAFMMSDSAAPVLVLDATSEVPAWGRAARLLRLPPENAVPCEPSISSSSDRSAELAYLIYTSGSTGQPKGVLVEHRGIVNMGWAMARAIDLGPGERMLQFAPSAFDAFVAEVAMSVLAGAALTIAPPDALMGPELSSLMRATRTTHALLPPSIVATLPQDEPLPDLRGLMVGGEACPVSLARRWARGRRFANAYGPTEITVCATLEVCDEIGERLPIGRPLEGVKLHVLDEHLRHVALGEIGELHVGGIGVARGYLRRDALSAERFIPDPFAEAGHGNRLYKTGDLGRMLPDGRIDYVGRADHQIKIRGLRIELGEIEAVLGKHPAVRQCIVIDRDDGKGQKRLAAYLVLRPSAAAPNVAELHAHLRATLPDFMVPALFTVLTQMPLTPNGKIDRAALPEPAGERADTGVPFVLATTAFQTLLHDQWCRLLSVDHLGVNDDFFMAGGDSLLAVQAVTMALQSMQMGRERHVEFLHRLLEAPTIARFAAAFEGPFDDDRHAEPIDFDREAQLDPGIRFSRREARARDAQRILLTGVTGFLGAFMLRELIERTDQPVVCLVRSRNSEQAMQRIRNNLSRYRIWRPAFEDRIIALPGDLARPRFGLSEPAFAELADTVSAIYHSGAEVNFLYPYSALKAANVGGTHEVIRLAAEAGMAPVHFVSTFAVLSSHGLHGAAEVAEDVALIDPHSLFMGYIESKWVSEQLLAKARAQGLPVFIHRPTHITGTVEDGAWKLDQFLCSLLQSMVEVESSPAIPFNLDFVPVDFVAKSIVYIGQNYGGPHRIFNLGSPDFELLPAMIERLRHAGYHVEAQPYDVWLDRVLRYATDRPDRPIANFMSLLERPLSHRKLRIIEIYARGVFPHLDCSHTLEALQGSGIACPPTDPTLIDRYIEHFVAQGLFPHPTPSAHRLRA
ncbi:MAG: amino acid adenylation domain-containing protein [Gammaproteobacteria bacterium]|nr:amino acid adenylation domain-containing protein [Gammaproteobacteria bacterium]MBU1439730.1 amino acid adenylation domain-containing protein [Gammaproteobacteria bacterium]MBU2289281.1 amino acid adenylation domain-containing protein [Gammaproteobacteria bacterium]